MKNQVSTNNKDQQKPPKGKPPKTVSTEKIKGMSEARRKQQRLSIDFDKQYRQIIFKKYKGNQQNNQPSKFQLNHYQSKSSQEIEINDEEQKDNQQEQQLQKKQLKLQFLEKIQKSPDQRHSPNLKKKPQKGIIKMPKEGTIQLNLLKLRNYDDEEDSFEKMFKEIEKDCEKKEEKVDPLKNLIQTITQKDNKNEQKLQTAEEAYKQRKKQLLQNIQAIKEQNNKPEDEKESSNNCQGVKKQSMDFSCEDQQEVEVEVRKKKFSLDIK